MNEGDDNPLGQISPSRATAQTGDVHGVVAAMETPSIDGVRTRVADP